MKRWTWAAANRWTWAAAKRWRWAAAIVALAAGYEFYADVWEWSEILFRISEVKFALVLVSWFIGFVMGHALAPHVSRFTRRLRGSGNGEIAG